ncbi:AbiV family abortive infection protein [Mycobacteroides abscessus]|uniref:AbiV family abortive infection protein n=1 Tax=Mycobacteroides abscessus TaxID=36809 RepID=UPI000C25D524|nr:AbiV family abortive infection protein [Mycobacteroides abscessus]
MQRLSSEQMAETALEAMRNARRLLDDAAVLAEDDRLPSAFMLVGLAADELGKHILVASFFSRIPDDDDWRTFWRRFRRHTEKLGNSLMSSWLGNLLTDDPPPDPGHFHQQRLAATYVDVAADGKIQTPAGTVTRRMFDDSFDSIDRELRYCESVLAKSSPNQLAQVLESMRTSPERSLVAECIEKHGQEAGMAFVIAIRSGMPTDQAIAFAQRAGAVFTAVHKGSEMPSQSVQQV